VAVLLQPPQQQVENHARPPPLPLPVVKDQEAVGVPLIWSRRSMPLMAEEDTRAAAASIITAAAAARIAITIIIDEKTIL